MTDYHKHRSYVLAGDRTIGVEHQIWYPGHREQWRVTMYRPPIGAPCSTTTEIFDDETSAMAAWNRAPKWHLERITRRGLLPSHPQYGGAWRVLCDCGFSGQIATARDAREHGLQHGTFGCSLVERRVGAGFGSPSLFRD